jgi:hypothetical protein
VTATSLGINVSPFIQKQPYNLQVSFTGGGHQCGGTGTALILSHGIQRGPIGYKVLDLFQFVILGSRDQ